MSKGSNVFKGSDVPEEVRDIAAPVKAPVQKAKPAQEKKYYDRASWKGVKDVFRCETCGTCRDDEDSMIEHVLLHIPQNEQEKIFNQLIKEK